MHGGLHRAQRSKIAEAQNALPLVCKVLSSPDSLARQQRRSARLSRGGFERIDP